MNKTFIDEMFTDQEYAELLNSQKAVIIEVVARRALKAAAKRFYDSHVVVKGTLHYDEVAEELNSIAKEV